MVLKLRATGFLKANPTKLTMTSLSNIHQENLGIFFFNTFSRYFGYASGTRTWLFKGLEPEKHLSRQKMELRQDQDSMALPPLLYSEAFELITYGA